ncbi:hypothetical protein V2J09_005583 [Rumex salicifolius]
MAASPLQSPLARVVLAVKAESSGTGGGENDASVVDLGMGDNSAVGENVSGVGGAERDGCSCVAEVDRKSEEVLEVEVEVESSESDLCDHHTV